jgi:glycosyltransferase involved in cell wall biosynthesis
MQQNRDVLLFSTADWDNPFWTNKQHMSVLFAKNGYRVLYVDSLGLRQPVLNKKDIARIAHRLMKAVPWPKKVRQGIWRASPLVLPWHGNRIVRALNKHLLRLTMRWHIFVLGMRRPLIWTYNPVIADLCNSLPHKGIVYHCVDDLTAAPHVDASAIERGERDLAATADLCFVTAPKLEERMSGLFRRVIHEPNVCDFNHFASARRPQAEPEALKDIPHPRLLFVGALSEYKVDFPLMEKVARRLPDIHWVLIGESGEGQPGSRKPPKRDNVHLLGPQAYTNLPSFMAHIDAAVLPAPINDYTLSMFPMKFFEYLASGLPVICTPLPALQQFSDLCFFAHDAEEFESAISRILAGERRDADKIDATCKHHSWEERFRRMKKVFTDTLG